MEYMVARSTTGLNTVIYNEVLVLPAPEKVAIVGLPMTWV